MRTVPCPTCNRPVEWNESSKWRPFCSERCKLIDLGAWASEKHAIPSEPAAGDEEKSESRRRDEQ
jgi:endogenous inhibitor of DNA gyrase (YacG/DUF329 family)